MMSNENMIPGEEDALFVIPTFNVEVRFFDLLRKTGMLCRLVHFKRVKIQFQRLHRQLAQLGVLSKITK